MVEFGILGSLRLAVGGRDLDIGGAKRRGLVARLLIDANQVVPVDRLIDDLWSEAPNGRASATVQTYVSQLRKQIGADRVLTRSPGYMLVVEDGELDADRFETLVARARDATLAPDDAVALLEEGERLWRGPALAEFSSLPWAHPAAERLQRCRVDAAADRADALLRAGRPDEGCRELEALVQQHPFEERLWRLLVVAHYRCGRQGEALRAYQRARSTLVDELGVEPSPALRALEQRVLNQDPSLELPAEAAATTTAGGAGGNATARRAGGGPAPQTVTVLVADIELPPSRRQQAAESWARARAADIVTACVTSAGGRLLRTQTEGDSSVAVFRLASDAVRAAHDVHRRLEAEGWPPGVAPRARVAVNTGEAIGHEGAYFGLAIESATRLHAIAVAGQVVVGASTAALVADGLPPGTALVATGTPRLHGLRRHEQVFELGPATGSPADDAGAPAMLDSDLSWIPPSLAEMVGRDTAIGRLLGSLDTASGGNGRLALVGGEPGAGKTRLLAEFATRARSRGTLVLYGRCDEDASVPYQPFVAALAPALRAARDLDLGSLAGDLSVLFPDLPGAGVWTLPNLDQDSRRHRLFEAVDRALGELARRQPVVLLLDDLQWADRAVLLLLRHVARALATRRIVVVAAFRNDAPGAGNALQATLLDLRRHLPAVDIPVTRLTGDEIGELLVPWVGEDQRARRITLAQRLRRETAGNALFVTEVVRDLFRADAAGGGPADGAPADVDGGELPLPTTVADLVGFRVARLQPSTQRFLTAAAVVGTAFDVAVAAEVAGMDEDTAMDAVDEATGRGIIVESPGAPGHLAFAHGLFRRALYARLAGPRRVRMHLAVAQALQCSDPDMADVEELARHFVAGAAAGAVRDATRYARMAGDRAVTQLSYETAIDHYRRALDLLGRALSGEAARERCELLLALADALNQGGDTEDAKERLLEAAGIAASLHDPSLLARAALAFGGPLPAGVDVTDRRGLRLLQDAIDALPGGDTVDRALLLGRLAHAEYWVRPRRLRAERVSEAVDIARRLGDRRALATVLIDRYWALDGPDEVEARLQSSAEVEEIAAELGDVELALQGGKCRLHVLLGLDAWPEALELAEQLRRRAGDVRQPEYERLALSFDAVVAGNAGRFDDAERLANRARDLLRQRGQRVHASVVHTVQLLPWRWLEGRMGERVERLGRIVQREPDRPSWRALLAWALAEAGEAEAAAEQVQRLDLPRYLGRDRAFDFWLVAVPSAVAAARLSDTATAALLYDALLPYSDRNAFVGQIAFLGCIDHHLGALALALGDDDAAKHLTRALDRHRAIGATAYAERTADLLRLVNAR